MTQKLTTETFINRARCVHGAIYEYPDEYQGSHTKITIICKAHGPFAQKPYSHINNKQGCPKCGTTKAHAAINALAAKTFIDRAVATHGLCYDYTNTVYEKINTKVKILCRIHGEFEMTPHSHVIGKQGCKQCGYESNKRGAEFPAKAAIIHGGKYDYSTVVYDRTDRKVRITCPTHGVFHQTPNLHLSGSGCPTCAKMARLGGFSYDYFMLYPHIKTTPGYLYVVRMSHGTESFIKVGITTQSLTKRFSGQVRPYVVEIIHTAAMDIYSAFVTEQTILEKVSANRYTPQHTIKGWTECCTADALPTIMKMMA